ncbi:Arsb, partial [Symbiodinium microadriaticum]
YLWANVRYEVSKDNGPSFKPKGYLSDYLSKEAARAISVNRDVPFFLFMAFTSMHTPFQALRSDFDIINALEKEIGYSIGQTRMSHCEKVYGAMLIALDRAVGNMLTALEENGLTNNTIVIFTNDNGAPAYLWDMNTPFRGGKASFFEGGIHVPFLLKWPNLSKKYDKYLGREQTSSTDTGSQSNIRRKTNIPSASQSPNLNCLGNKGNNHFCKLQEGKDMGIVIDNMVAHMDIFPTVLEAAGVELSESYTSILDGKSLIPLLKGAVARSADTASDVMMPSNISAMEALTQRGTSGHQDLFWRSGHYMAYRKGNWKIQSALRPNKKWLYNLAIDPGERYNLADVPAYREKLNEMVMEMQRENYSHSEPIWPALSETPCLIDKLFPGHYVRGDEYVYWCN